MFGIKGKNLVRLVKNAQTKLILNCIFDIHNLKSEYLVPLLGSSAASTAAHFRMAPAMASGPNPDLHVWHGDWFGPFVHLLERLPKGHS